MDASFSRGCRRLYLRMQTWFKHAHKDKRLLVYDNNSEHLLRWNITCFALPFPKTFQYVDVDTSTQEKHFYTMRLLWTQHVFNPGLHGREQTRRHGIPHEHPVSWVLTDMWWPNSLLDARFLTPLMDLLLMETKKNNRTKNSDHCTSRVRSCQSGFSLRNMYNRDHPC